MDGYCQELAMPLSFGRTSGHSWWVNVTRRAIQKKSYTPWVTLFKALAHLARIIGRDLRNAHFMDWMAGRVYDQGEGATGFIPEGDPPGVLLDDDGPRMKGPPHAF